MIRISEAFNKEAELELPLEGLARSVKVIMTPSQALATGNDFKK